MASSFELNSPPADLPSGLGNCSITGVESKAPLEPLMAYEAAALFSGE